MNLSWVQAAPVRWLVQRFGKANLLTASIISTSGLFQAEYYSKNNPDLSSAHFNPLMHFVEKGWSEGRNPNPFFDVRWYLQSYPDVAAEGINPLRHYIESGEAEGKSPGPDFDAPWYRSFYADVAKRDISPLRHFLEYGQSERRRTKPPPGISVIRASGLFQEAYYLQNNPDVSAAGYEPLTHFVDAGWSEGRNPNPFFDVQWYLTAYQDVANDGINPLQHYVQSGASEGRNPGPEFDTLRYLQLYPDVASAALNPLRHFLEFGSKEGRSPRGGRRTASLTSELDLAANRYARAGDLSAATLLRLYSNDMVSVLPFFLPERPLNVLIDHRLNASPTLRILLPSVKKMHATGGPNTAYLLGCLLARGGIRVAFVSTDTAPDENLGLIKEHLRSLVGYEPDFKHLLIEDASDRQQAYPIGVNDVFLATAWWTAQAAAAAMRLTRVSRIYYLIQDYEPLFYAASENSAGAESSYEVPHFPIVNSTLLHDHLVENRVGLFRDAGFADRASVFQPAVDTSKFHPLSAERKGPRRLLFYARPTIAQRNLFGLGIATLRAAIEGGLFGDGGWEFIGMGESFDPIELGRGYVLNAAPWLDFSAYAELIRGADILLSLMLSPHPSYPPLEMAACGGVTVTTTFGSKSAKRLKMIAPTIFGVRPSIDDLVGAIAAAIARNDDPFQRIADAAELSLPKTWVESLSEVVERVTAELLTDGIRANASAQLPPAESFVRDMEAGFDSPYHLVDHAERRLIEFREGSTSDLLTIITPVFNTDYQQLIDAAQSVFGQDTRLTFEWLILDNGSSSPGTVRALAEIARDNRVRIETAPTGLGMIAGTRWCLENARNRYILPLDHDDLLFPDAIRTVTAFLEQNGFPALIYSNEDKMEGGLHRDAYFKPGWDPVLFVHSCYTSHLAAIDRKVAMSLSCYSDNAVEGSPDWDTFIRFMNAGYSPRHLPEILYSWRIHANSTAGNFRSKPYIFKAHRRLLSHFLEARGRGDRYEVAMSPIFSESPDYRFRKSHAGQIRHSGDGVVRSKEFEVLSLRLPPENVAEGLRAQLDGSPNGARYVHLTADGCDAVGPTWREEAEVLLDLFDDGVMIGGRIHDGSRICEAAYVFGYGEGVECPDAGRLIADPGYFAQMWKPRSVDAVSARHCVVELRFLIECLNALPIDLDAGMLGPWLGALAARSGRRVIYSPFFEAVVSHPNAPSKGAQTRFNAAFGNYPTSGVGYGQHLDRSGVKAYMPAQTKANLSLMPYVEFLRRSTAENAGRGQTPIPRGAPTISILTTVYFKTNVDLFIETADAIRNQTHPPIEWIVLAHGPISIKLRDTLKSLAEESILTVSFETENLGIRGGLRYCLERARGDFAISIDADDLITIDAVEVLTRSIVLHPTSKIFYSNEDLLVQGQPRHPYYRPDFDPALLLSHSFVWHAIVFDREAGLSLGAFTSSDAEYAQDWDLMLRFYMAGRRPIHIDRVLYHWRQHPSSLSNSGSIFEGSLASVRAVLTSIIESRSAGDTLEVARYPFALGAPDYYLRRLPVSPPEVDLIELGASSGSRSLLSGEFHFHTSNPMILKRGLEGFDELLGALKRGKSDLVFMVNASLVNIEPEGLWQAAKHFELLAECAAVSGCVTRFDGAIVAATPVLLQPSSLVDTRVGMMQHEPGLFSMGLKPHCIDAATLDILMVRRAFVEEAVKQRPSSLGFRSLGAWLGWYAARNQRLIVYEPMLSGRLIDSRTLAADPIDGLNRALTYIAGVEGATQTPRIRGQSGFVRHAVRHGM